MANDRPGAGEDQGMFGLVILAAAYCVTPLEFVHKMHTAVPDAMEMTLHDEDVPMILTYINAFEPPTNYVADEIMLWKSPTVTGGAAGLFFNGCLVQQILLADLQLRFIVHELEKKGPI